MRRERCQRGEGLRDTYRERLMSPGGETGTREEGRDSGRMLGASAVRDFVTGMTMPISWTPAVRQALSHMLHLPVSPLHPMNRTCKTGPNSPTLEVRMCRSPPPLSTRNRARGSSIVYNCPAVTPTEVTRKG